MSSALDVLVEIIAQVAVAGYFREIARPATNGARQEQSQCRPDAVTNQSTDED